MNIKNKIYHTAYFLLFGIIVGILRWSICIVDTNGTMDFTPFLQAFLLIVALLLFVILDIILHKIALRAISITFYCVSIYGLIPTISKQKKCKNIGVDLNIHLMTHIFHPILMISFLYGWRAKFLFLICSWQQVFHIY